MTHLCVCLNRAGEEMYSWRLAYHAAIFGTDETLLRDNITKAEEALHKRLDEIDWEKDAEEFMALSRAMDKIILLKMEKFPS
jgi:hypothetical protein